MVTVQTATPEQIADCVLTLKRHIDRVEAESARKDAEIERLRAALVPFANRYQDIAVFEGQTPGATMVRLKWLENAQIVLEETAHD